jgi:hypothetical protein
MKDGWHAMMTLCNLCSHKWASVFPEGADATRLECPRCGAQNSQPLPPDGDEPDPADAWKQS